MPKPVIPGQGRPQPPADLSERERKIWLDVVESRPLNYFGPETWPLLRSWCVHCVQSEDLSAELRQGVTKRLRDEFRKQTQALCTLSSKLRLCKQGRRKHQSSEQSEIAKTPRRRLWLAHDNPA